MNTQILKKYFLEWVLLFATLSILPLFIPEGWLRVLIIANYYAIFAMGWNAVSGSTGYISFGHNFIIGLAAYTSVLIAYHLKLPLYVSMPLGVLAAVLAIICFYLPALRVKGPYFSMVTLALFLVIDRIVITLDPITGGTRGLFGFPQVIKGSIPNFYLSLILMVISGIILSFLIKSDFGKILDAIRQNESVVNALGINANKFKLCIFIISAITTGFGAVFFVHYLGALAPETVYSTFLLINIIIMGVIGGIRSTFGAIVGAYIMMILLEVLRPFAPGALRIILYAAIGLAIFMSLPTGVYPSIKKVIKFKKSLKSFTK